MKKISKSTLILLAGIAIFLVGCIQPANYEKAKESGYEVKATVVDIVVKEETDSDGYSSTSYTIYGNYTVDGQSYQHVKVGKYYDTTPYSVGDVIPVVVDPDNPDSTMFEGGILCVIGFVVVLFALLSKRKNKKSQGQHPPQ